MVAMLVLGMVATVPAVLPFARVLARLIETVR